MKVYKTTYKYFAFFHKIQCKEEFSYIYIFLIIFRYQYIVSLFKYSKKNFFIFSLAGRDLLFFFILIISIVIGVGINS